MRQVKLLATPISAIKNSRRNRLFRNLVVMGILFFCLPSTSIAQPTFSYGSPQALSACENDMPADISSLLTIGDPTVGNLETWTVNFSPAHGALAGFPTTGYSNGTDLTIGPGLTYVPTAGFYGTDSFQIKISDGMGGVDSTTIIVTVTPPPFVDVIYGPTSVCIGSSITLTDDSSGGSWSASNAHALVSGGVVSGITAGRDTISYTIANGCGSTTVTTNVTVTLLPVVGPIFGSNTVCPSGTISLFDATSGGVWSAFNANATVSSTGLVNGVTAGIDTIYYTVSLTCGTTRVSFPITVNTLPASAGTIVGPHTVCVGSSITLTDATTPGTWNVQNGDATIFPPSGVFSTTNTVTGVVAGLDTIIYSVINGCGATQTFITVNVLPQPVAGTITGTASVCVGSATTLADAAPGGTWTATNGNATIAGGVVTGVAAGMDTIVYTVVNSCNTAVASRIVTINPLPNAGAIAGLTSVCVGSSITLTNFTAAGAGTWSTVYGYATVTAAGVVTGVTANIDTVKFTYTNVCGTAVAKYPVTVNPLPDAGAISGRTSFCNHDTIHLSETVTGGHFRTTSSTITLDSVTGVVTGVASGTARIIYSYTNFCGTRTVTHLDTIIALPDSGVISGLTGVCGGLSINLTDTSHGGSWTSSNTHATVSSAGVVTGVTAGVVTVSYSVTNVCRTAVATHIVTVDVIPSAGTIIGDTAICPDSLITLTDASPGGVWTSSNDTVLIDASGVIAGKFEKGHATITYTITNECGAAHTSINITTLPNAVCWHTAVPVVTTVNEAVSIFPNPATDELIIKTENGSFSTVTISNQIGQAVIKQPLKTHQTEINIHALAPGMYNITLTGESGIVTKKLVKQ